MTNPLKLVTRREIELFLARIEPNENGCHICTYYAAGGYPRVGAKRVAAHRLMYAMVIDPDWSGDIDEFVCHSCDVKACVNPEHLWLGDAQANREDCVGKGRANITPRQPQYAHLLGRMRVLRKGGLSYEAIGDKLGLSWQTIRTYLLKFGVEE